MLGSKRKTKAPGSYNDDCTRGQTYNFMPWGMLWGYVARGRVFAGASGMYSGWPKLSRCFPDIFQLIQFFGDTFWLVKETFRCCRDAHYTGLSRMCSANGVGLLPCLRLETRGL